jgi:OTU-like cysteine protease
VRRCASTQYLFFIFQGKLLLAADREVVTQVSPTDVTTTTDQPTASHSSDFPWCVVVPVPFDGNCMFAALADQICRAFGFDESTCNAATVRFSLVEYLRNDEELHETIASGLDEGRTIDGYFSVMAEDGTYGDGNTLSAACRLYSRPIEIYTPGSQGPMIIGGEYLASEEEPFRLGYVEGPHYVSLVLG